MIKFPIVWDNYIFNELKGIYSPGDNVDIGTMNDENANKIYIGTYFPRSWAECYTIFNELYVSKNFHDYWDSLAPDQ